MELREAIELIVYNHPKNGPFIGQDFYSIPATQKAEAHAFSVILNAVADGTLVPADAVFQVREGAKGAGMVDHIIHKFPTALEIRSADDVRREVLKEAASKGYYACAETRHVTLGDKVSDTILALIDTPQPKGGDDV